MSDEGNSLARFVTAAKDLSEMSKHFEKSVPHTTRSKRERDQSGHAEDKTMPGSSFACTSGESADKSKIRCNPMSPPAPSSIALLSDFNLCTIGPAAAITPVSASSSSQVPEPATPSQECEEVDSVPGSIMLPEDVSGEGDDDTAASAELATLRLTEREPKGAHALPPESSPVIAPTGEYVEEPLVAPPPRDLDFENEKCGNLPCIVCCKPASPAVDFNVGASSNRYPVALRGSTICMNISIETMCWRFENLAAARLRNICAGVPVLCHGVQDDEDVDAQAVREAAMERERRAVETEFFRVYPGERGVILFQQLELGAEMHLNALEYRYPETYGSLLQTSRERTHRRLTNLLMREYICRARPGSNEPQDFAEIA